MIDATAKLLLIIRTHLKAGRIEDALQDINLLLTRDPESGKAQAMLGHLQFRYYGNPAAAEEAFKKAMRVEGDLPELYLDYGELLLQTGKYTEMVAVLNKATEIPMMPLDRVNRLFGMLYERQARWDEAMDYYTKAILYTLDNDLMDQYEKDLQRCRRKQLMP